MNTQNRTTAKTTEDYLEQLPGNIIRALRVLRAMSDEDRTELLKANELIGSAPETRRDHLRNIIINVETGPWGDICPYCGRR